MIYPNGRFFLPSIGRNQTLRKKNQLGIAKAEKIYIYIYLPSVGHASM